MGKARNEASAAEKACRAKRLNGELKSFSESAECSSSGIRQAYLGVGYAHMDLVEIYISKRIKIAQRIDRGELLRPRERPSARRRMRILWPPSGRQAIRSAKEIVQNLSDLALDLVAGGALNFG